MKKSHEQEQLQFHLFFRTFLLGEKYNEKYRDEIFSKNSVFHTVRIIIEKESALAFNMLLGVLKQETSIGHQIPRDVIFPLLINCLYHLKILSYDKELGTLKVNPAVLDDGKIILSKIVEYLNTKEGESFQKYSKLFQHIIQEYQLPWIGIEGSQEALEEVFNPDKSLPPLDMEQQIRMQIFSTLLLDYFVITGLNILDSDGYEKIGELLMLEEGVVVKEKDLNHKYSERIKGLMNVLEKNQNKHSLLDDTVELMKKYLTCLLTTLSYNEVINQCFNNEGKYANTVKWLEEQSSFELYDALSLSLSRCEDFQLARSGNKVFESFLAKNEHNLLSEQNIKHTFYIYYNLGQMLHNLKLTEEGVKYFEFLIDNYSSFQASVAYIENDDYIDIVQNLINIYYISDNKVSLQTLKERIVAKDIPHNKLFAVQIGIFCNQIAQEDAKKLFGELNALYGSSEDLVIRHSLQYIADFTEDKNIARNIKLELPTEKFSEAIANKEFGQSIEIFTSSQEYITQNDIFFYVKLIYANISLENHAGIQTIIDLIPTNDHKAHAYYMAARFLKDDGDIQESKFEFLDLALSYKESINTELYNAIVYYGIICSLKFSNKGFVAKYQALTQDIDIEITNIWAKSLFDTEYKTHEELIVTLAKDNHLLIDEYYKILSALPNNKEIDINWLIGGKKLSIKDTEVKLISEERTIKKYGYIDPKLKSKVDNFEEYEVALESGVASRAFGQDGVKWYYSDSKKAQGNCSGHKIKVGKDNEMYGHKIFSMTDNIHGVEYQLCLFDHYGNHTDMENYFINHPKVEILGGE